MSNAARKLRRQGGKRSMRDVRRRIATVSDSLDDLERMVVEIAPVIAEAGDAATVERDQMLAMIAALHLRLDSGTDGLVMSPDQRLNRHLALDRAECTLRGYRPIVATIRALERCAEYIRNDRTTPAADIEREIARLDELRASPSQQRLRNADPEAFESADRRLMEMRAAYTAQLATLE